MYKLHPLVPTIKCVNLPCSFYFFRRECLILCVDHICWENFISLFSCSYTTKHPCFTMSQYTLPRNVSHYQALKRALSSLRSCGCHDLWEEFTRLTIEGKSITVDYKRIELCIKEQCWSDHDVDMGALHSGLASGHLWIWPLLKTIKWVSIPKSRHFQLLGTILTFILFLILTEKQYTELSQFYNFIIQRKFYNLQVKKYLSYSILYYYAIIA